jgi:cytochrome b561
MPVQWRNNADRYGAVAQLFHWVIVALIITQFVLINQAEALPRGVQQIAVIARHKSFGMTILMLATLRLLWRFAAGGAPALPDETPGWQRLGARLSHVVLYGLLFAMPLSGWLMSSARNFPVSWFGVFTFPDLVGPNRKLFDAMHETHELLATVLFCVAILHVLAALKHHFIDRDNVLRRMLPVKIK